MARKSSQKNRPAKPTQAPTQDGSIAVTCALITVDHATETGAVIRRVLPPRLRKCLAQAVLWSEATRKGKQREIDNLPADEQENLPVASGSATRPERPLKRTRTVLSVEPSDRVLRSRQSRVIQPPQAPRPPSEVDATEDEEERPRKRVRIVAPDSTDGMTSEPETPGPSQEPELATHKGLVEFTNDAQLPLVDSEASPSAAKFPFPYRMTSPPPRVRLMGPGMDPYFVF